MKISRWFALFAAVLLLASSAFAQGIGTTSSVSGTVTSDGKPLPGVSVTVSSPALQGTRTAVTGEGGGYNFPGLPPGLYTITYELEGMQRMTKKAQLFVATPDRIDVEMKLASVAEAITVTASAPAVLETTEVARNFDQKQIAQLPVRRNVRDTVLLAPGVTANGPNNQLMVSGGPSYDNLFLVNGVVVNENLRGQPHNLFIEDAIQETTVLTGGISAEYGRFTGGVVSTLTKSGGNDFHASVRNSMTNPKWIDKNDFEDTADDALKSAGKQISHHPNVRSDVYEGTLGGFVFKDRLWFFGAGRHTKGAPQNGFNALASGLGGTNGKDPTKTFTGITFLNTIDENRYEGKLTGNLTQKHTLVGSYLDVKTTENNNFFAPIYDTPSIVTQRQLPNSLKALAYNGVLTSNTLIEAQVSQKKFAFVGSGGIYKDDQIRGTWIQDTTARFNAPVFCGVCTPEDRNNDLASVKGHYYLNTKSLGNHDFVGGGEKYKETRLVNNNQSASNYTITSTGTANFLSGDPTPYGHFDTNSRVIYRPILVTSTGDHFNSTGIFANDKWDVNTRLNINLGVRYDKQDATDATGNKVSDDKGFSPRLGALWDVRGNGRDRVDVNYARYSSKITDGNAGGAGNAAGTPASFSYRYTGPVINPIDGNGVIVGTPVAPQAALKIIFDWFNAHCDSANRCGNKALDFLTSSYPGYTQKILNPISTPYVDEVSLGYGHQFGSSAFVKVDLINRKWHDFYAVTITQATGQITAPNGAVNDLAVLVNDDNTIKRTYNAAQMQFNWRAMSRLNVGGGYTFSHLKGNDTSEADGTATSPLTPSNIYYPEFLNYAQRNPTGYLLGDVRHRAKMWLSYDQPTHFGNFNYGVIQSADSGRPYSAAGTINIVTYPGSPAANAFPYYTRGQLGTTSTYFFSKRGEFRTPSVFSTDFALNYELPLWKVSLFAQGQVINIFNNSHVNNLVGGQFDSTIRTANTSGSGLVAFNPFTTSPSQTIECPQGQSAAQCTALGANFQKGPLFGTGLSKDAFQTPRTYRASIGLRF